MQDEKNLLGSFADHFSNVRTVSIIINAILQLHFGILCGHLCLYRRAKMAV